MCEGKVLVRLPSSGIGTTMHLVALQALTQILLFQRDYMW